MAKSKSRTPATTEKKTPTNPIVKEFYAIRAEVKKVTWPTREQARSLSIAVTVGTVAIALFLFLVDLLFEGIIAGIVVTNIPWIIAGVVMLAMLAAAFVVNARDV